MFKILERLFNSIVMRIPEKYWWEALIIAFAIVNLLIYAVLWDEHNKSMYWILGFCVISIITRNRAKKEVEIIEPEIKQENKVTEKIKKPEKIILSSSQVSRLIEIRKKAIKKLTLIRQLKNQQN